MALSSDPRFRVHHSLRIKGFAKLPDLIALSAMAEGDVTGHLTAMQSEGLSQFREKGGLWQLTAAGREAHPGMLDADAGRDGFRDGLAKNYEAFLHLNEELKALCGEWQLRDGQPNDHTDAAYDKAVVAKLGKLDASAQPVTKGFGDVAERFAAYAPRLSASRKAFEGGAQNMFTGVMVGSYHDVWMELHEDLLLTQNIDRKAEGSF